MIKKSLLLFMVGYVPLFGGSFPMDEGPIPGDVEGPLPDYATIVWEAPPLERTEAIPPQPTASHIWIGGHWTWNNGFWVWANGYWTRPPNHSTVWEPGRWVFHDHGWLWVPGKWVMKGQTVPLGPPLNGE